MVPALDRNFHRDWISKPAIPNLEQRCRGNYVFSTGDDADRSIQRQSLIASAENLCGQDVHAQTNDCLEVNRFFQWLMLLWAISAVMVYSARRGVVPLIP
jgi:hypothetical protein